MYDRGGDLEQLSDDTRVSYASVRAMFPLKPRDTVTKITQKRLGKTTNVLLLTAVQHPAMPIRDGFVRAKVSPRGPEPAPLQNEP